MVDIADEFLDEGLEVDFSNLKFDDPEVKVEKKETNGGKAENCRASTTYVDGDANDSDDETSNDWLVEFFIGDYPDKKKKVLKEKLRSPPYANLLKVQSTFPDPDGEDIEVVGTAVLVGPKHALTSYHNIIQREAGEASKVEVSSHFGGLKAQVVSKFNFGIDDSTQGLLYYKNVDIVLLILDKNLGLELGYLPMAAVKTLKPLDQILHIAGLTTMENVPNVVASNEGKCIDKERSLKAGLLIHDMRSDNQMAGCPIYAEVTGKDNKTQYYIIGIQSYKCLKGTLITEERFNKLKAKIAETKQYRSLIIDGFLFLDSPQEGNRINQSRQWYLAIPKHENKVLVDFQLNILKVQSIYRELWNSTRLFQLQNLTQEYDIDSKQGIIHLLYNDSTFVFMKNLCLSSVPQRKYK